MKNLLFLFLLLNFSSVFSQWVELNTGNTTPLISVSAVNDNLVWACSQYTHIIKTTNGGTDWTVYSLYSSSGAFGNCNIFALDENTAFVCGALIAGGDAGRCYKTTDGGLNWSCVLDVTGGFFNGVWMKNENEGILTGDPVNQYWKIYKTTDGGNSWFQCYSTYQSTPEYGIANSIYSVEDNIWIGTSLGKIYFSSNFGTSWTKQNTDNNGYQIDAIYFLNSQSGFCSGPYTFKYTSNSGTNWITANYPPITNCVGITGSFNELLNGSADRPVWRTTNQGVNWTLDYQLNMGILRNHLMKSRTGGIVWDARNNGNVGKRINPININQTSSSLPNSFNLFQNYPNPFNPNTIIRFQIKDSRFTTLKVYDILGKEVATLVNKDLKPGVYEVTFDGSNLTSGIYFYQLKTDNFTETKKLTLLK